MFFHGRIEAECWLNESYCARILLNRRPIIASAWILQAIADYPSIICSLLSDAVYAAQSRALNPQTRAALGPRRTPRASAGIDPFGRGDQTNCLVRRAVCICVNDAVTRAFYLLKRWICQGAGTRRYMTTRKMDRAQVVTIAGWLIAVAAVWVSGLAFLANSSS